jgi:GNAT superfamily N-acetyltransferase
MLIRCSLKSGTRLFLAWRNGRPVGGGALETHDGVAALMAAGTLPAFRNQGIHTALLRARLLAAAEAGCDLAMVHTRPGAASQRNVLRAGFQWVYTVDTMVSSG